MSLKSSRFRQLLEPPCSQMQPRCTGSVGVASTVVQVTPPSYVYATYRCQAPGKVGAWSSPAVVVPRNAKAARLSSPAYTSGNWMFLMPSCAPTSTGGRHALEPAGFTEIHGRPSLRAFATYPLSPRSLPSPPCQP